MGSVYGAGSPGARAVRRGRRGDRRAEAPDRAACTSAAAADASKVFTGAKVHEAAGAPEVEPGRRGRHQAIEHGEREHPNRIAGLIREPGRRTQDVEVESTEGFQAMVWPQKKRPVCRRRPRRRRGSSRAPRRRARRRGRARPRASPVTRTAPTSCPWRRVRPGPSGDAASAGGACGPSARRARASVTNTTSGVSARPASVALRGGEVVRAPADQVLARDGELARRDDDGLAPRRMGQADGPVVRHVRRIACATWRRHPTPDPGPAPSAAQSDRGTTPPPDVPSACPGRATCVRSSAR